MANHTLVYGLAGAAVGLAVLARSRNQTPPFDGTTCPALSVSQAGQCCLPNAIIPTCFSKAQLATCPRFYTTSSSLLGGVMCTPIPGQASSSPPLSVRDAWTAYVLQQSG